VIHTLKGRAHSHVNIYQGENTIYILHFRIETFIFRFESAGSLVYARKTVLFACSRLVGGMSCPLGCLQEERNIFLINVPFACIALLCMLFLTLVSMHTQGAMGEAHLHGTYKGCL
jgi:hypothetical protein